LADVKILRSNSNGKINLHYCNSFTFRFRLWFYWLQSG